MNKFIKFLIVLFVILLLAYFAIMNMPKANIKNKEALKSVSATELFQEFETNEDLASKNYIGKVIEVSGTIQKKMLDEQEAPVVLLGSGNENQVLVTLEADQASKLNNYNKGDQINIKAQCSGMLMEVVMNKGIIAD